MFALAPRVGVRVEAVRVNAGPGLVARDREDKIVSVLSLEILGGVIQTVLGIVNPEKLQHLGPVSDLARTRRRAGDDGDPGV
jgi:RNA polymerase sigma-70 factor (ECF subfamily)